MDGPEEFDAADQLMASRLIEGAPSSSVHDVGALLRISQWARERMLRRIGSFVALDGPGERVFAERGGLLDAAQLDVAANADVLRALCSIIDALRVRDEQAAMFAFWALAEQQQDAVIWALARQAHAMEQAAGGSAQLQGQLRRHQYHLPVPDLASRAALAAYIVALAANGDRAPDGHAHQLLEELFGRDKEAFGAVTVLWLFALNDSDPATLPDARTLGATEAALRPNRPASSGASAALQIVVDLVDVVRGGTLNFAGHGQTLERIRQLPADERLVLVWQAALVVGTPLDHATLARLGVPETPQ